VRALARRPQGAIEGVTWIAGALDQPASLAELVEGAEAVIHVAGVVNVPDRAGFAAGNIEGTRAMLAAAGARRFIHVSSLAAREPGLSDYGWSKAEAEAVVRASPAPWTMIRPPAIFGPGDREMLELFRVARRGLMPLPPGGRLSVIAVEELGRLLLDLLDAPAAIGAVYEADDGKPGGWTHKDFARAIGVAVGRKVLPIAMPRALLDMVAWGDKRVRGAGAKLTPDRVRYFCHPDWACDPAKAPPAAVWAPGYPTAEALAKTVEWYRAEGLL
jgi:uncharacterized protein YbjT (DUF2867 family)